MTQGKLTYDLRRLRLHGLIARIPHTHRYVVTDSGLVTALFLVRAHARLLRPGLATLADPLHAKTIRRAIGQFEAVFEPATVSALLAA